jgi:acylphosphatase
MRGRAMKAVHLVITGQVQGVGYRAWFADEAQERGLSGWVRNRRDGSVEAVVTGVGVEAMVAAAWDGPGHAEVKAVVGSPWDQTVGEGFEVKGTE